MRISEEFLQTLDLLGICLFLRKLFSWRFLPEPTFCLLSVGFHRRLPSQVQWPGSLFACQSRLSELSCFCSCKTTASGARGTGCCDPVWMPLRVPKNKCRVEMELELLSHQDAGYSCVNVDRGQRIPLMELPGLKESDFWTFPKHI